MKVLLTHSVDAISTECWWWHSFVLNAYDVSVDRVEEWILDEDHPDVCGVYRAGGEVHCVLIKDEILATLFRLTFPHLTSDYQTKVER